MDATQYLARHYRRRLERLVILRRDCGANLNGLGLWLMNQAIFATYLDCREVGIEATARETVRPLLGLLPVGMGPPDDSCPICGGTKEVPKHRACQWSEHTHENP